MKTNLPVTTHVVPIPEGVYLVSQTDLKGAITHVNDVFVTISGFARDELIGRNHNVVRHPDVPPAVFADMWACLKQGLPWRGIVKNRCKNGDCYWVDAQVTPILKDGAPQGYMSVRKPASAEQIRQASSLYEGVRRSGRFASVRRKPSAVATQFFVLFGLLVGAILTNLLVMALDLPQRLDYLTGVLEVLALVPLGLLAHTKIFRPLRAIERQLEPMSEGDLSRRFTVAPPDEVGRIANALIVMQTRWLVGIERVKAATRASLADVEGVHLQAHTINERINDQHDRVAAVAAATEEFSQAVAEVANCSQDTAAAATTSGEHVEAGRRMIVQGMESARAAVESVGSAHGKLSALGESVTRVGAITSVIQEIADQTNLLALNAAIEAARAGESGRGFAVVADEVRKLADRTRGSTSEISAMVGEIQRLAVDVDDVMLKTMNVVNQTTEHMQEATTCFSTLEDASQHTVRLAQHIADAAQQQTLAGHEVARNMEHIAAISEGNQQDVSGLSNVVRRLNAEAGNINSALSVFKIAASERNTLSET